MTTTISPDPWTARVWSEFHSQNLTRAYRDVLLTLRTYRGSGGKIYPSHATLADRVGCSTRTVQRALAQALRLGLVSWVERRVRAAWRWLRTSNAYRLLVPESPVIRAERHLPFQAIRTTGQDGTAGESKNKQEALRAFIAEAAAMPDLLVKRQIDFGRKLSAASIQSMRIAHI